MLARVARFLKRYVLWWYAVTVLTYALMIPLTILVFPATTLLLTIVVLFGGFTSSIAALASVTADAHQDEQIEDLADDGRLNSS